MEAASLVENAGQLIEAMGYWPSFHDANVDSVKRNADSIEITVHLFAMTDQVDPAGYYILEKHHLASFSFENVAAVELPPEYQGDCLDRLWFEPATDLVVAHLESHMGLGGRIVCSRVVLRSVVPCSPKGVPLGA